MKLHFRLFQRHNGIYFCEDRQTGRQRSLFTRDKTEAHRLVHAMNEAQVAPLLNRQIARAYLVAADESMVHRTWCDVLDALIQIHVDVRQLVE